MCVLLLWLGFGALGASQIDRAVVDARQQRESRSRRKRATRPLFFFITRKHALFIHTHTPPTLHTQSPQAATSITRAATMVVLGALKVLRLHLVPLERLLARVNKSPRWAFIIATIVIARFRHPPTISLYDYHPNSSSVTGVIPLKDRVLSSKLLLEGDPSDWLRRGAPPGSNGGGRNGGLFLVPKRALRQVIAHTTTSDSQPSDAHEEHVHGEGHQPSPLPLAVAVAAPPSARGEASSALALLESGEGFRITLPGLLAQARDPGGPDDDASSSSLLAQTMRGLAVEHMAGKTKGRMQSDGWVRLTTRTTAFPPYVASVPSSQ